MKNRYILIVLLSLLFGIQGISQTMYRSDFYNIRIKIKSTEEEFASPKYGVTYFLFEDNTISIHVFVNDMGVGPFQGFGYKTPIGIHDFKIISEPDKNNNTIYFTRNGGYYLIFDHKNNTFTWTIDTETANYKLVFDNLTIVNECEYIQVENTFNVNNPNLTNFSCSSQNLIGYHKDKILYKYSRDYKEPVVVNRDDGEPLDNSSLNFESKSIDGHNVLFIFNDMDIVIGVIITYPIDYLESLVDMYNKSFKSDGNREWISETYNCNYKYTIEERSNILVIRIGRM